MPERVIVYYRGTVLSGDTYIVIPNQQSSQNQPLASIQPLSPIPLLKPLTIVLENNEASIMNKAPFFCDWGFWGSGYLICQYGDI